MFPHDMLAQPVVWFPTARWAVLSVPPTCGQRVHDLYAFERLIPYAATLRYDDIEFDEGDPFDRARIHACVLRTLEWARQSLGRQHGPTDLRRRTAR